MERQNRLPHVAPGNALACSLNSLGVNTVVPCQRTLPLSICIPAPNISDGGLGQLSPMDGLASQRMSMAHFVLTTDGTPASPPCLLHLVTNVVKWGASKQVGRINTQGVVACVTHELAEGDGADGELVGYMMDGFCVPVQSKGWIPAGFTTCPEPAACRAFLDSTPELGDERWGIIGLHADPPDISVPALGCSQQRQGVSSS